MGLYRKKGRNRHVSTSLEPDSELMEQNNWRFQAKYRKIEENEVEYEMRRIAMMLTTSLSLMVLLSRICQKSIQLHVQKATKLVCYA